MQRQIVFVLSTNYAGSHFLSLQLASHSRCISLGEFHRYKRSAGRRRQACSICPDDEQCPVFHGLENVPLPGLFPKVFENIGALDPAVTTGIDNSKKHDWAERFVSLAGFDQRIIHLIRDPRALVRRWMLCYDGESAKGKVRRLMARRCWRRCFGILRGPEDAVYVHKWAYQNRLISAFLQRHQLNAKTITYHDLVHYPEPILSDLMSWLGLSFEPTQLRYWEGTHHGSQKPQYMQPPPASGATFHDLRWREFLSDEVQQRVAAHPETSAILAEHGISLAPAGLTLHPDWPATIPPPSGSAPTPAP